MMWRNPSKVNQAANHPQTITATVCGDDQHLAQDESRVEIRRRMYERIAQGHAITEVEEGCCAAWHQA